MEKKKLVRVPPDIGGCPWILGKIEAAVENGYQVLVENCGLMEWWDGQVLSGFLNGLWGKRWFGRCHPYRTCIDDHRPQQ